MFLLGGRVRRAPQGPNHVGHLHRQHHRHPGDLQGGGGLFLGTMIFSR